jgi:hypothetical protein
VRPMPYKFNETRRHKIPKVKYRVTNWPEYDAALVRPPPPVAQTASRCRCRYA